MRRVVLVAFLALLAAAHAYAADGAKCDVGSRQQGGSISVTCTLVCDSKTSVDTTCANYAISMPADTYILEIAADDGCSAAATVDVDDLGVSTSDEHNLTSLVRGGTTKVVIHGEAAQLLTLLDFDLSTMTDCTDFDVKLWQFYERR